ncbi:MAG: excinuclease ABC subunit A [Acidobacteria bacterium]|nr:MAG: excinuclease ABC subunit A [Acidobacteriota bacterium]
MLEKIVVRGARQHNLKNIHLEIPRHRLTVVTGLSGSGKSSLAFDTIYAEGQRRYIESLSAFARQFLEQMEKPDVDSVEGLSPAISIAQKTTSRSPRSTVGTVTEIYDYMRLLFASVGKPHCHVCGRPITRQSLDQIVESILAYPEETRVLVLAPVVRDRKGEFRKLFDKYLKRGYVRARVDGRICQLEEEIRLSKTRTHTVEVVVDRVVIKPGIRRRLEASVKAAMELAEGLVTVAALDREERLYSERQACPDCGVNVPQLEPRSFSFNSKYGACPECQGVGIRMVVNPEKVILDSKQPIGRLEFPVESARIASYLRESLLTVARNFKAGAETPFERLPARAREVYFQGSREPISYHYGEYRYSAEFKGVGQWLEELHRDDENPRVQEEVAQLFSVRDCPACGGSRLRPESRSVKLGGRSIADFARLPLDAALEAFRQVSLGAREEKIAGAVLKEICDRLQFLVAVGVSYLTLDRSVASLSGGEGQRIRLATQIGSKLRGVLYVLDEPSIGLHPRDNRRLIDTLGELRDMGNTILVVEHDEETIRSADHVVDLGPGAGRAGGHVVVSGSIEEVTRRPESLTGQYLSGTLRIEVPRMRRAGNGKRLVVRGARHNNLKDLTVEFPLGLFICVTGVSGSGKSSLVDDILYRALSRRLQRALTDPGAHDGIDGIDHLDKVIEIDQSPIGRTPRSNPATYTGLFTHIRELFALLPESRMRGYKPGRFSFNVKGGRCETCQGDGLRRIEMNFLPDVYVTCETCQGKRYNRETLAVKYKGYSIADLLDSNISDAAALLAAIPPIAQKLATLEAVGLGYVQLGQSATTLSGGEAQRVKLSRELSRRATGRTLYILDEPTTGLHFHDVKKLLDILNSLVDRGNTVLVIEHNLDVIKMADWIIDLGPEGGERGGLIVAAGTPEQVRRVDGSETGRALGRALGAALQIPLTASVGTLEAGSP